MCLVRDVKENKGTNIIPCRHSLTWWDQVTPSVRLVLTSILATEMLRVVSLCLLNSLLDLRWCVCVFNICNNYSVVFMPSVVSLTILPFSLKKKNKNTGHPTNIGSLKLLRFDRITSFLCQCQSIHLEMQLYDTNRFSH